MTTEIDWDAQTIDSRDIIARIEELEQERETLVEAVTQAENALHDYEENNPIVAESEDETPALEQEIEDAESALAEWEQENKDELRDLKAFAEEVDGYCEDWRHGVTLVAESYFVEYCREMLQDCGDLPKDIPCYLVIDWEATADNIRADYTEFTFRGSALLAR